MARHGSRIVPFVTPWVMLFTAAPLFAQQSIDDRVKQLEQRLDQLTAQMTAVRQELDALKRGQPAAETAAQPAPAAEDLTKVDLAQPAPAAAAPTAVAQTPEKETPPPALTDVQTVSNAPNPGASKVFNPDTSVIGNFIGKAGQPNAIEFGPDDRRAPLQLDEAEVAFEAFVDPYAKAKFFLSAGPEGLEIEEGYANFVALPYGLTAKAGKFKANFGKANTWHTHVRPWVDQPLVIHNFFGDEQLADSGISVSKDIENPWHAYIEATGEVLAGKVERVFDRGSNLNNLVYNAHLKAFRDITENSNVEVGTSYARGTYAERANSFAGLDLTYRWKPLEQGLYRSLIGRVEAIANRHPYSDPNLKGFYASIDYQLAQRWFTGLRVDAADRFDAANSPFPVPFFTDHGVSATLTFWPSEFSQLRGQLRRTRYGDLGRSVNELLLQLQFAIGAHGAHTF